MNASGRLLVAATPIGDPADASARFVAALATAGVIAAEDTRRVRRLAADLGVTLAGRVVSHYDANEAARVPELLAALQGGDSVLLVTDAGTPVVSDPGYRLVRAAIDAGITVTALPGPSAAITALMLAGLPVDRWCFEGFLSRRGAERRRRIAELAGDPRTLVLFEAPHRLAASLADLAAGFGPDRPAAVCRELTKTHEEVRRGTLGDLAAWAAADPPRGEITLVVGGAPTEPASPADTAGLAAEVDAAMAAGASRRDAVDLVAGRRRLPRRVVYDAALAGKSGRPPH